MPMTDEMRAELREIILKHGTHDQKTHGSWSNGRSAGSIAERRERRKQRDVVRREGAKNRRQVELQRAALRRELDRKPTRKERRAAQAERRREVEESFLNMRSGELRERFDNLPFRERERLRQLLVRDKRRGIDTSVDDPGRWPSGAAPVSKFILS